MGYRTILVELTDDSALEARLQLARTLAGRFDAALIGMHAMPSPFVPASYGEASAYLGADLIEAQRQVNREIGQQVQDTFRRICGAGPNVVWQEAEGDPGRLLAEAARTTDLILARQAPAGGAEPRDLLDQLVTAAGVPVLALPGTASGEPGQTVVVAWNGAREATRAVHDAMPFLQAARRVALVAVGDPAAATLEAAAAMLRRHGLKIEARREDGPDGEVGEILLDQCRAQGADLLVMGAYGHTRLRELVFGGATRHVLRAAALPVLFGS